MVQSRMETRGGNPLNQSRQKPPGCTRNDGCVQRKKTKVQTTANSCYIKSRPKPGVMRNPEYHRTLPTRTEPSEEAHAILKPDTGSSNTETAGFEPTSSFRLPPSVHLHFSPYSTRTCIYPGNSRSKPRQQMSSQLRSPISGCATK